MWINYASLSLDLPDFKAGGVGMRLDGRALTIWELSSHLCGPCDSFDHCYVDHVRACSWIVAGEQKAGEGKDRGPGYLQVWGRLKFSGGSGEARGRWWCCVEMGNWASGRVGVGRLAHADETVELVGPGGALRRLRQAGHQPPGACLPPTTAQPAPANHQPPQGSYTTMGSASACRGARPSPA